MKTSELRARMNRAFDHDEAVDLAAEVIRLREALAQADHALRRYTIKDNEYAAPFRAKAIDSARALLTEHDER